MVKDVIILGGKGGGTLAAQTILALSRAGDDHRLVGYLNDKLEIGTALYGGSVLARFDDWARIDSGAHFIAPVQKAGAIQQNMRRVASLLIPTSRWIVLIDPSANVADDTAIGIGSVVAGNAQVGPDSIVGDHCFLRANAIISHDVKVSNHVYVGQGSIVLGYVRVETGAHIAPGAVVRDGVIVGQFALVGLGSVVTRDVPPFAIVRGVPAVITGFIEPIEISSV